MPIAIEKFFDAVFQCCRKTKAAKDSRPSLDTTDPDQNPDKLGSMARAYPAWSDDCLYYSFGDQSLTLGSGTEKRWPHTGSNISKPPTLFEIPIVNNPAAWVSSKTQKDSEPIKN